MSYSAILPTTPLRAPVLRKNTDWLDPYKEGLIKQWDIKKFNLDELYVRFMRLAQRRITEGTKQGVVCFVSSFSYLSDPSFVVMRQRLLNDFDSVWIDCLNGDSRETGKKTPSGEPDPSVFSTKYNTAGIRLGTAIGLFTRKLQHNPVAAVHYRDFWGKSKRAELRDSLAHKKFELTYIDAIPSKENRFSFRPHSVSAAFRSWPRVVDLCEIPPIAGLQEMRFGSLMAIDRKELEQRVSSYLNPAYNWAEVVATDSGPVRDAGGFNAKTARANLLTKEVFSASKICRYSLYPLDNRWAYWTSVPTMWNCARPQLVANAFEGNKYFIVRMTAERPDEGVPAALTGALPDYHLLRPNVVAIPFVIESHGEGLFASERTANLSKAVKAYLGSIGSAKVGDAAGVARLVWLHALAVCYSPSYLAEHRDGILGDWPRIPLPSNIAALEASAELGERLAALLDLDTPVPGVTTGKIDAALAGLGMLARLDGKPLKPTDLALSAGWGYRTAAGVVMPGGGRAKERKYTADETSMLDPNAIEVLGPPLDVSLNDSVMWRAVPKNVWEYRIGGYQVVKKWLSYREESGTSPTVDERRSARGKFDGEARLCNHFNG